ncbi:hypothetical protein BB558_004973 [Smittium angustum]|uniref:Uncharacterized protein n=1 Tax=Smittium angustum TaxID=133377 RepID=A0A2U1IWT9_SMIAN|nr:hypothetical protein BB558_006782 [Smittium angustum]PVZ99027.1 hypothetical protein BB558_004973 [Smittium angustum]
MDMDLKLLISLFLDETLVLLAKSGILSNYTMTFSSVKNSIDDLFPLGILYYEIEKNLEVLSDQLGKTRVLLAKQTGKNFEHAVNKLRMGMIDIIESKKISRLGETTMLISPTSSEYINPIASAMFCIISRIVKYITIHKVTKNSDVLTAANFLYLLKNEKQLKTIFSKTKILQRIVFGNNDFYSKQEIDHAQVVLNIRNLELDPLYTSLFDTKLNTLSFSEKKKIEKRTSFMNIPSIKEWLGVGDTNEKNEINLGESKDQIIIKTSDWKGMDFEELLNSGKTLVTPFDSTFPKCVKDGEMDCTETSSEERKESGIFSHNRRSVMDIFKQKTKTCTKSGDDYINSSDVKIKCVRSASRLESISEEIGKGKSVGEERIPRTDSFSEDAEQSREKSGGSSIIDIGFEKFKRWSFSHQNKRKSDKNTHRRIISNL